MDILNTATRFALGLDREDYDAARACLSPQAVYRIAEEEHRGPDAILASYKQSGDWAAQSLDTVSYESQVRQTGPRSAVVAFVDRIEHAGEKHVHRCEQRLTFDSDGRIARIQHIDLPGEPEALAAFFRQVGLARF